MSEFHWNNLGDIDTGRAHLGPGAPVLAYRLMQYTLRDVLVDAYGVATADHLFVEAGKLAGIEFCRNVLDTSLDMDEFLANFKSKMAELKIGLLRFERFDLANNDRVVTIAEDLDCSGLPATGGRVCHYDEGCIAGILAAYTGRNFEATEIDCWASGARVCRFVVKQV